MTTGWGYVGDVFRAAVSSYRERFFRFFRFFQWWGGVFSFLRFGFVSSRNVIVKIGMSFVGYDVGGEFRVFRVLNCYVYLVSEFVGGFFGVHGRVVNWIFGLGYQFRQLWGKCYYWVITLDTVF